MLADTQEQNQLIPSTLTRCDAGESHHGFPTLEADAGLNVVAAPRTFLRAVVIQHRAGESLQRQLTCTVTGTHSVNYI